MDDANRPKPTEPTISDLLAAHGFTSMEDWQRQRRDRYFRKAIEAHRAAQSAIAIAMITSAMPGIEVRYIDGEPKDKS